MRTPGAATASRTPRPNTIARLPSGRRAAPTTPHAIRALQQRKNAATPGRDRRRSGRQKRETPREALRELSKLLARNTAPIEPSPRVSAAPTPRKSKALEDLDLGPDVVPPRLSIPLGAFEDDDSFHKPPSLSEIPADDKENYTARSVETRRDGRFLERDSLTGRLSDVFNEKFADVSELEGGHGDDAGDESAADSTEGQLVLDEITRRTLAE